MSILTNFHKTFLEKDPFKDILGQEETKQQLKSALLTGRHVIIAGPPGIGKTTLAKNIAGLLPDIEVVKDCRYNCSILQPNCPWCRANKNKETKRVKGRERFIRIQGSSDLTAEDLIGDIDPIKALKFGPLSLEAFTPGKIFRANNGILFFDELNRCPEKLQNTLLQVLEEGKATIGSYDVDFHADFIFIGTMNPEDTSTEKLSDVFIDRFDLVYMSYPESIDIESEIVRTKANKVGDIVFPVFLLIFTLSFIRSLRDNDKLIKKPSVRASIGLYERAINNAFLKNKKEVELEDIEDAVISVISHRIELKPSLKYMESAQNFVKEEFIRHLKGNKEIKEKRGDCP